MLQCCKTGRNPTMRHLLRSHRVSVAWIHEQYKSPHFAFAHESGEAMPPDVFTKMFADKDKWKKARQLISIILPEEFPVVTKLNKEITEGILEKPALAAVGFPNGGIRSRFLHHTLRGCPRKFPVLTCQTTFTMQQGVSRFLHCQDLPTKTTSFSHTSENATVSSENLFLPLLETSSYHKIETCTQVTGTPLACIALVKHSASLTIGSIMKRCQQEA